MNNDAIREEYRKTLALPPLAPPGKQVFLCPVGLVGAGKTTAVKPLAERLSLVRISSDDIRHLLKSHGLSYEPLLDIVKPLAEDLALAGYSLAFDGDCGNPKTKQLTEDLALKTGAKIFWIHINPPEEFILNKLRTFKHTWLFKDGEEAVGNYFKQKETRREQNTRFDFLATIDTSRPDLHEQIDAVAHLIESKLV